jgi:hypothetical protein
MRMPRANSRIWIAITAMGAFLCSPTISRAQGSTSSPISNPLSRMDGSQTAKQVEENGLDDPKAAAEYNKFHSANEPDKKIKLGKDFINRYPSNYRVDAVYEELAQAYYAKNDLANFYAITSEGMTRFPNDPTLLSVTGATMARAYNHDDPDADQKLEKAENYEKQALDLMKNPDMPPNMSDKDFAAYKKQILATAHSGLGLIYFRQAKFDDSVKELEEAMQDAASPDPTDYLILGGDYQNLNKFKEAADAFNRCAQVAGPLQAGCKTYADQSQKQAAQ